MLNCKNKFLVLGIIFILLFLLTAPVEANQSSLKTNTFKEKIIISDLEVPWAMVWGPNDNILLTEKKSKNILKIDLKTGEKHVLATIEEASTASQHKGLLGLALAPNFLNNGGDKELYLAYTYENKKTNKTHAKIIKFKYDLANSKLVNPTTVIDSLPAGDDHNGGRLIFGSDNMLYYSIGEMGNNQFANICNKIEAQRLPSANEIASKDWSSYVGKVLRLTVKGEIPEDNPVINGVKSHIYSYGHRNPQGLIFVNDELFSVEHGPSSDDELNKIEAGGNYGWPNVAGFKDDSGYSYINWSSADDCEKLDKNEEIPSNVKQFKESDFNEENFKEPLKTFFTVNNAYNFANENCAPDSFYLCWPTIAPSNLTYYPKNGPIIVFRNSLLISTLKSGAVYVVPLDFEAKNVQGDIMKYFKSQNRYRDILISPDARIIYVLTDIGGGLIAEDGKPAKKVENRGSIIAFEYMN